ncbi:hypothetical protein R1sor_025190 [Riccia sorocarpa]|uniref:NADP-dependent oxidoreductase domain-containing protein n=1 Tax=Riccia sorocarpa TaxID=122646 RepID=A0ABD3G7W0_9MARC
MGVSAFDGPPKPDEEMIELIHKAVDHVHKAVEHDVTLLDTSDVYGPYTNEILVGKVVDSWCPVYLMLPWYQFLRGPRSFKIPPYAAFQDARIFKLRCGLLSRRMHLGLLPGPNGSNGDF